MKYGPPKTPRAIAWLRLATTRTTHGGDLEIPGTPSPYDVDQRLLEWEREGWISRGYFEPDLSQRALGIVHPDTRATMAEAKKVLEFGQKMGVDLHQSTYWWLPGPKAAEALDLLPPAQPLQPGDEVRYRRGFLRSIGLLGDDDMICWRGRVEGRLHGLGRIVECATIKRGERSVRTHEGNVERAQDT